MSTVDVLGALAAILLAGPAAGAVTPPPGVVTDGIPPIPASIVENMRPYSDFRPAVLTGWHPTRREALILAQAGETAQVFEVGAPGVAPRQLTTVSERVGDARWPRHAQDYLLFVADDEGNESWQMYRLDLGSGGVTRLSDGGSAQNLPGPWSNQRDLLAFSSTRRNGVDRDIYVMDPRDPASARRVLDVSGAGWIPLAWSPDDRRLAVLQFVSAAESYLWSVEVDTGAMTSLTPRPSALPLVRGSTSWNRDKGSVASGNRASYSGAQWSPDGQRIYTSTDRGGEFKRLAWIDPSTGRLTYLTPEIPWDVDRFALSPDGRLIAYTTNEDGTSVLHLLDAATARELSRPALPTSGLVGDLHWHSDGNLLGFTVNAARTPGDVYALDVTTGQVARWLAAGTGSLDPAQFPEPEHVRWTGFDRRPISGLLYRPPARFAGPRPVLVVIHGGPEGQSRPGFLGSANYFLLEMGVAVLMPNVRGSTGYGKTFATLDDRNRREDAVRDLGAMLDWIARRRDLDATRVMLSGGSYGGYMSLAATARYGSRVRCAMSVAGISNFVSFLESTGDYRRDFRRVEYGDERDRATRSFLTRISPLSNAGRIERPLFIVQGRNDPRVPYTEAEQMVATVKRNGAPVWYLLASDEGHGFARKTNQDYQFQAAIAFMQAHLLPAMP